MNAALNILEELAANMPSERHMLEAREVYGHQLWREAFVGLNEAVATQRVEQDVAWLLDTCPSPLSRSQILAIKDVDPARESRRILFASLMWGYGTGLGRWPQRLPAVGTLLADHGLDDRLERCRDRLAVGDVVAAYRSLMGIAGIGCSFFTKFLYFLGRSLDPASQYPLVLDTKVAGSLAWLTGLRELVALDSYWPKSDPDSYAAYVTQMHGWARHLGTTADVIEYYLWRPPATEFRAACKRAYLVT